MHFADLGDIRVHYSEQGPQDGPVKLILYEVRVCM